MYLHRSTHTVSLYGSAESFQNLRNHKNLFKNQILQRDSTRSQCNGGLSCTRPSVTSHVNKPGAYSHSPLVVEPTSFSMSPTSQSKPVRHIRNNQCVTVFQQSHIPSCDVLCPHLFGAILRRSKIPWHRRFQLQCLKQKLFLDTQGQET